MYIVSVIPLLPGISKDTLTYSSEKMLHLGSIILCPFRNKNIDCIVIEIRTVREAKADLRNATFVIKKINSKTEPRYLISENYVEILVKAAHHYGIAYSDCFYQLLPKSLYSGSALKSIKEVGRKVQSDIEYLEIPKADTEIYYKKQVISGICIIVTPTKERVKHLANLLSNDKPTVLHSGVSAKKQNSILLEICNNIDSLYICTPQFVAFFQNATKIYLDNFSSEYYKTSLAPHIDTRRVLEEYSTRISNTVTAIDSIILRKVKSCPEYVFKTIDMTDSANGSKYIWQSAYLKSLLEYNKIHNKKTLLYVHRKGLSSYLACNDCKAVISCSCGSPFTLSEENEGNRTLKCNNCRKILNLNPNRPIACTVCGSWKLQGYGVSTQLVHNDLISSGYQSFIIDSEHTKTAKSVANTYQNFCDIQNAILVSTEAATDYFDQKIDSVCLVSIDSLLLLPDYNTDFKVLRKIINLASFSKTMLHVQTRLPRHLVLKTQNSELYITWKKEYLKDLAKYSLPPYGINIRIVRKGYFTDEEKKIIKNIFVGHSYTHSSFRSTSSVSARIATSVWEDNQTFLSYKLSLLRPGCDVFIE